MIQRARRIELRHPSASTPILVGPGAWREAGDGFAGWLGGRALFVVTTPRVWGLHAAAIEPLARHAERVVVLEVAEGEAAKRVAVAERLWREMLRAGGRRSSRLLAFGGGSVGDLGGFVAGCFLRGIEVAQGPTTLLAQVDASIGGKTAVDLDEGKNTVGLVHHPRLVVSDPSLLSTLPAEELRSGLAEAVKVAFVASAERFAWIEAHLDRILARQEAALVELVGESVVLKSQIVERDPADHGERQALNFGHTLGHAIEAALGYGGLRHGEAVVYGMLFALRLAEARGLDPAAAGRLRELLRRLSAPPLPALDAEALLPLIERDKKASGSAGPGWVLPAALGEVRLDVAVPAAEIRRGLEGFLADPWESGP